MILSQSWSAIHLPSLDLAVSGWDKIGARLDIRLMPGCSKRRNSRRNAYPKLEASRRVHSRSRDINGTERAFRRTVKRCETGGDANRAQHYSHRKMVGQVRMFGASLKRAASWQLVVMKLRLQARRETKEETIIQLSLYSDSWAAS